VNNIQILKRHSPTANRPSIMHNLLPRDSFRFSLPNITLAIAIVTILFGQLLHSNSVAQEVDHAFVGFGKANGIVVVDEGGGTIWHLDLPASEGWMLGNGNILAAIYPTKGFPAGGVVEIDRETKKFVWQYAGQQKEISSVQKINDNEYLVAELGDTPRAIVINNKGEVLREMKLQCQKENAHMQTRMLRLLPNGNYIAPHLLDFAVKEYDPTTGDVVKTFATDERGRDKKDWPFTAIRLENGNTVIGCTNGNRVIEVDEAGKIVWSVDNDDLGEDLIADACGVQRLPNGNTIIASYRATGGAPQLIEVSPDKKVVWKFSGLKTGIHHFQILTTNGEPLATARR
jgi:outer membrane protein assembly factor BamB